MCTVECTVVVSNVIKVVQFGWYNLNLAIATTKSVDIGDSSCMDFTIMQSLLYS